MAIGDHTTGMVNGSRRPAGRNRTLFLSAEDRQRIPVQAFEPNGPVKLAELVDRVTCGDSMRILPLLPDGCADLVMADPPYNVGKDFGVGRCRWRREQYARWLEGWLGQCARLVRSGGSVYVCCDWRFSGLVHEVLDNLLTVRNRITWRREKGRGAKRNWKNNLEDIFFATRGEDYTFNLSAVKVRKEVIAPYRDLAGRAKDWRQDEDGLKVRQTHPSNIWTDLAVPFWSMPENTPHPAQKSEKLLERILLASSNEGDLVLDPFLGSGTTAVVARRLKRRFVGLEMNPDYCRLAIKRLAREEAGTGNKEQGTGKDGTKDRGKTGTGEKA